MVKNNIYNHKLHKMELTKDQKKLQKVVTEAWSNPTFKQNLISSPIETIENLTGERIQLPKGVERLEVVDQSDATCFYLNIPSKPNMEDVELSEDELDAVTGGNGTTPQDSTNIYDF